MNADSGKIRQWLDAVIHPDTEGWIHVARGIDGKFNDKGRYEFKPGYWRQTQFRCPRDRGEAVKWLAEHAQDDDVYASPYATKTRQRAKGNTVGIQLVHSDVDTKFDIYDQVIDRGNGFVVASGSPDHGQVFIPLADEVTTDQHEALCRGLSKRLSGDSKISDNDVLRPAGSISHKGRARGKSSTLVDFVREPQANAKRIRPHALAVELGVDLSNIATTNGSSAGDIPGAAEAPKPVDMSRYPWIQETLDEPHTDRSTHINHVVRECYCAGLPSVAQARWVVNRRADLVAKLAELKHDDVLRNWEKTAAEWPHPQIRIAAIVAANSPAVIDEAAFWDAYPELTACRDYARSVRVGPWAMLGAALTVVTATIPPDVVLPDIVGDYASVNLYVNLVGPSGSIKSQAVAAARAWLQTMSSAPDPVKPGSGQDVAKCFAYVQKTKNGGFVQVGKRWTAVAMIPEVDTLTAAGSMTGSSLWVELRSAWSDERVGHDYADPTKSVVLQPRRYRLCMIVGVQPLRAGPLFDDVDAGTPQRFVWLPVDDPGAPKQRPAACDQLQLPSWGSKWVDPSDTIAAFFADEDQKRVELLDKPVDRDALTVLTVPAEVTGVIDAVAREKLHGNPGVDPLDGHKFLCQLKIAAALMRLCGRDEITSKDWELAGIVMAVSDRTRAAVQGQLDAEHNRRNLHVAETAGARKIVETRMAAKAEAEDVARVAEVIVAALTKAGGQTMTGAEIRRAAGRDRDRQLVPKALEYLEIDGRIKVEEAKNRGPAGVKVTLLSTGQQTK